MRFFEFLVCFLFVLNFYKEGNGLLTYCGVISLRRQWHPTPVLLPRKSHGRRSLEGCSLWGCWGSDTTERLPFHFSLSCIGEGNGNPLQCSCLENPRDGGAWWAAVYGVAQSWTRLKWLSSSSSSALHLPIWVSTYRLFFFWEKNSIVWKRKAFVLKANTGMGSSL